MPTTPTPTLSAGQSVRGFTVQAATAAEELYAVVYRLEHERSGARLLHVHTADPENLFSISFLTPPPDNTGLPHILEHAVLAGSRRFPVKEPFFEMVKMSMATFINAMTGPDCTYYPVASNVRKDLFNLAEVYVDAVFHPLLTEATFRREGHHLAPADRAQPLGALTTSGIVYNEMKGAFSDPESRLYRAVSHGLLPNTIYSRESGGDPVAIPDLTYDDLRRFHATFYHPGNAFILMYGDIPTDDHLAFLAPKLDAFERIPSQPPIGRQARWTAPRRIADTYPIEPAEPAAEKTFLSLDWLTGDSTDALDAARMHVLSQILLGHEAAPLKKALIDSKLGADLLYSGCGSIGCEATFSVGLKGSESDRADAFVDLVWRTLSRLVAAPFTRDDVASAFRQSAYYHQEIHPMFPLHAMQRVLHAWIYGMDPLAFLRMRDHLAACRHEWEADPGLFNRLIRERLLDNPHRLLVTLRPDREMTARVEADFARRMREARARLSDEQAKRLASEAEELDRLNSQPNPPEALASLPQLAVSDLPARLSHIATRVESVGNVTVLANDVFANGVNYLGLHVDLRGLPADLWAFLPRFSDAIVKLGASGQTYEQIARRVAAFTGGVGCRFSFDTRAAGPDRPVWGAWFNLKTLDEQIEPALALLRDLLFGVDPRDRDRLRDVLIQARARYRTELVHNGSGTARSHAARGFSVEGHLGETVYGLPQLALSERLARDFDSEAGELMRRVEAVRDFLLVRSRLTVSFTGSERAFDVVRRALADWTSRMRDEPVAEAATGFRPFEDAPREGLAGPIQVAHCAQVMPAPHASHPDEPLLAIGTHLVSLDYVMNEVRLKGNAYGAGFGHDASGRMLLLTSFRDPNIVRTLEVFAGVAGYVHKAAWTQTDIDRAIIAVTKREERPVRPASAMGDALHRHLTGRTPEVREARYQGLRAATPRSVRRALLDAIEANQSRSAICVVASREKLEEANARLGKGALAIRNILEQGQG